MRTPLISVLFATLLLTGITSCNSGTANKNAKNKRPATILSVEGYIVKPTLLVNTISVSGTLLPFEETVLMPETAGRVVMINLPEGKFVKQGTILVKMYDGELQAMLKKSQTQLQLAEQTEDRKSVV